MLLEEFEKLTGVHVTAQEYKEIEADYMACEDDKLAFCKDWLNGGGPETLGQARLKRIDALEAQVKDLTEKLEAEQEWQPTKKFGTRYSQHDYELLERKLKAEHRTNLFSDFQKLAVYIAKISVYDPMSIMVLSNVSNYEINRHGKVRKLNTYQRPPLYVSDTYNYARFDVCRNGNVKRIELIDGELFEYNIN